MQSVGEEDLQPYAASAYAWRWQDPRYAVLPTEVLETVRALRPERARQISPRAIELDAWACKEPTRVKDVETESPAEIADWLRILAQPEEPVVVSWHVEDAVLVPWRVFAAHWDDFWYPASDDVTVFPLSEAWVLSCDHEGRYSWRARS